MTNSIRPRALALVLALAACGIADAAQPVRKTQLCNTDLKGPIVVHGANADLQALRERILNPSASPGLWERLWRPTSALIPDWDRGTLMLGYHPMLDAREILRDITPVVREAGATRTALFTTGLPCWPLPYYGPVRQVVEYYNARRDHYRLLASADEERELLAAADGDDWKPTGQEFTSLGPDGNCVDTKGVARFSGIPGASPDTEFLTADAGECGSLWREGAWHLEGIAFWANPPVTGAGRARACPRLEIPVYRFYNDRSATGQTNHRYVWEHRLRLDMSRQGWIEEGLAFCVPTIG